jgi:ABC-type sugar transport system ATPase subunit
MIHQELSLAPDLTGAENLLLGREPLRMGLLSAKRLTEEAEKIASHFGFEIDLSSPVSSLSTATCQQIEILKALSRSAKILVLDEPTSSLSEHDAKLLLKKLKELRQLGLSIIYISHRLEEIEELADDLTVLRDGSSVFTGPVRPEGKPNISISEIIKLMVGRPLAEVFPAKRFTAGQVVLETKNLSASGVFSVDLQVKRGEIVGLGGLIGAGRTELVETIFGARKKTSGEIYFNGQLLENKSPSDAIRSGIGLLTEDRKRTGLCLELPCAWNVTLPAMEKIGMKYLLSPSREEQIAIRAVEKMKIKWAGPSAPATSLSDGNQQKLLLGRWLLTECQLLIVDEPTRGIDVGAKLEVYEQLVALAALGKAILVVSSELPELLGLSHRVVVMCRGKKAGELDGKSATQEQVMALAAN